MTGRFFPVSRQLLFPGPWYILSAVVICLSLLSIGVLSDLYLSQPQEAWSWHLATGAFFWWLMVARCGYSLACAMTPLRLPGVFPLLTATTGLHLLLAVLLPMLVLWLLLPQADIAHLGGALALGSSLGFLALCLPGIIWGVLLSLPLIGRRLPLPASAWEYWMASAIIMALAAALWVWRCRSSHGEKWWLMSLALLIETSFWKLLKTEEQKRPFRPSFWDRLEARAHGGTQLAEVLGPRLKSLGQVYGWRGQSLTYLLFASAIAVLLWVGLDGFLRTAMLIGGPIVLLFLAREPALWLAGTPGRYGGQALHAELLLLPGLPAGDLLLPQVCRQIAQGLANKLGLLTLMIGLTTTAHGFPIVWVQWFVLWALLMLPTSLLMALLAWSGAASRWQVGLMLGLLGLGTLTSALLYLCEQAWAVWLLAGWVMLGLALLAAAWQLYQHVRARGAPFSS